MQIHFILMILSTFAKLLYEDDDTIWFYNETLLCLQNTLYLSLINNYMRNENNNI